MQELIHLILPARGAGHIISDSISLRFELFKRMYENGSKIALNSTCSKEAYLSLRLCDFEVFVAVESF